MGDSDGVEIRPNSLRLFFVWNGERFKETLRIGGIPLAPTAPNILHARRVAADIRKRIELGTFVLAEFFPESKRVAKQPAHTFGVLADQWMQTLQVEDATRSQYRNAVAMWKRVVGATSALPSLTHQVLAAKIGAEKWASARSFNNYMIPLRGIFAFHYRGPLAATNPLVGITNRRRVKKLPDPLTGEERDRILADLKAHYDPRVWAYYQFAFFTGMRPEEMIALRWGDIDFGAGVARVQRVRTFMGSERDGTKTNTQRDVDLVGMAIEALEAMKPLTKMKRDDVFENPVTGRPWHDERSQRDHYWKPALKRLGIRERRSYATRHTYCTVALMGRVNPAYIAAQAGHSVKQLLDDYARWILGSDGGRERASLEQAMRAKVPQESPESRAVIGRRDWTRTNPPSKPASD